MKKLLVMIGVTFISASAFANENTGCGLGSQILANQDSLAMQVFASTTNNTVSGNQTFGITSGTLGCTAPSKIVFNEKTQQFVAGNMDALAAAIANGQGESVDTLAELMQVADKETFAALLQQNFSQIYPSDAVTAAEVMDNIASVVS